MNAQTHSGSVAVVCDRRGQDAVEMEAFLQTKGITQAQWYTPRDMDDVDKAVRARAVRRVVFLRLNDLLVGLWNGQIASEQWLATGTQVELVEAAGQTADAYVGAVLKSWGRWRGLRRRRQLVAGVILSVAALAAAFVLNWVSA